MIQTWSAADYDTNARFVSDLGQPVLDLLQPQAGERILDLGCGDGALTIRLAEAGAKVVGIDSAPDFLAASKARGLDARLMDAHHLTFHDEFDAVFTSAVLHWIKDIDAVLAGVYKALHPGGRFVGEFGGHACVASICTALRAVMQSYGVNPVSPWYFPTPDEFRAKLEANGFIADYVALIPRPTPLPPGGVDAWLHTFARPWLNQLPEHQREQAKSKVIELLKPALCDSKGNWTADYTRVRFNVRKPA